MLSKFDFASEDNVIRVRGVSLMVFDRNSDGLEREINNLLVGLLQLLCLEKLYAQEAEDEDKAIETINGKEIENFNLVESFQNEN